ncbi:MAG: FecR domain-containing protein, partial [Acidobacteriota bacterium]
MRSGKRLIDSRRGRGCVHLLMAVMIFTLVTRVVRSQESDESPDSVDIVARISLLAGEVSYQRTRESGGDWYEATINLPLAESDQLYTGSAGRVEIQISSGDVVRLSHDSNLRFTRFNRAQRQLSLPVGTMTMRIETIDGPSQEEVSSPAEGAGRIDYEVSTPAAAITLRQKGVYRVDVAADGTTELHVREGQAEIFRQEIGSFNVGE